MPPVIPRARHSSSIAPSAGCRACRVPLFANRRRPPRQSARWRFALKSHLRAGTEMSSEYGPKRSLTYGVERSRRFRLWWQECTRSLARLHRIDPLLSPCTLTFYGRFYDSLASHRTRSSRLVSYMLRDRNSGLRSPNRSPRREQPRAAQRSNRYRGISSESRAVPRK